MFLFPNLFWSSVDRFMTPQCTCDELRPQLALQISKFPDKTPRQMEIYVGCHDRLNTEWEGSLMGIRAQRAYDRSIRQEIPQLASLSMRHYNLPVWDFPLIPHDIPRYLVLWGQILFHLRANGILDRRPGGYNEDSNAGSIKYYMRKTLENWRY